MAKARADDDTVEIEDAPSGPSMAPCRWCGKSTMADAQETPNWLCPACGRYQTQVACPTCHQPASFDVLPPDVIPAPVDPVED